MAMKKCKECGAEISSSANQCPKCGKVQKNFFERHIALSIISGIILLIIIVGIVGGGDSNNTSTETSRTTLLDENKITTEKVDNTNREYNVGEIYEDSRIAIKYVSLNDNFTGYSKYANVKSGYKILKADFEFENMSNSDLYVSSYEFDCYADGYDCDAFWSVDDAGFSSSLSSGKKTTGSVYFEVPENATDITIEYTNNVWTSDRIVFRAK